MFAVRSILGCGGPLSVCHVDINHVARILIDVVPLPADNILRHTVPRRRSSEK